MIFSFGTFLSKKKKKIMSQNTSWTFITVGATQSFSPVYSALTNLTCLFVFSPSPCNAQTSSTSTPVRLVQVACLLPWRDRPRQRLSSRTRKMAHATWPTESQSLVLLLTPVFVSLFRFPYKFNVCPERGTHRKLNVLHYLRP